MSSERRAGCCVAIDNRRQLVLRHTGSRSCWAPAPARRLRHDQARSARISPRARRARRQRPGSTASTSLCSLDHGIDLHGRSSGAAAGPPGRPAYRHERVCPGAVVLLVLSRRVLTPKECGRVGVVRLVRKSDCLAGLAPTSLLSRVDLPAFGRSSMCRILNRSSRP